jgi:tRNA(Ile)-lysidine synthase TilS/MesJ
MALLYFLTSTFGDRRDVSFIAVRVEEGHDDRQRALDRAIREMGVEQARFSMQEEFGISCILQDAPDDTRYRALRKKLIQKIAWESNATRIAQGSTLDDEAYRMIKGVLEGYVSGLPLAEDGGVLPWIRPFMTVPEREVALYAHLNAGITGRDVLKDYSHHLHGASVRSALEEYTARHPATLFALANLREAIAVRFAHEVVQPGGDLSRGDKSTVTQKEYRDAV